MTVMIGNIDIRKPSKVQHKKTELDRLCITQHSRNVAGLQFD